MELRHWTTVMLALLGIVAMTPGAHADELKVLETGPAANAVLE